MEQGSLALHKEIIHYTLKEARQARDIGIKETHFSAEIAVRIET